MNEPENIAVYRVSTAYYEKGGAYHFDRSIRKMRRMSGSSFDLLSEEVSVLGEDLALSMIKNLCSVKDGLYTLQVDNIRFDWETGIADGYDLMLVPYGQPHLKAEAVRERMVVEMSDLIAEAKR